MNKIRSYIKGVGHNVPDRVVTNDELSRLMDTTDPWIVERPGIKERRFADEGVGPSDLAIPAVEDALQDANLSKDDIDARNLPKGTSGVVITKIDKDSPINYLQVNNVIVEANRKKINTIGDLDNVVKLKLRSDENNLLIAIYNNQNQRTYIGVKLK